MSSPCVQCTRFFFVSSTATTEIYTLSLHDALPSSGGSDIIPSEDNRNVLSMFVGDSAPQPPVPASSSEPFPPGDRKSTRLNSSHMSNSYAVFCLKKKNCSQEHRVPSFIQFAESPFQ